MNDYTLKSPRITRNGVKPMTPHDASTLKFMTQDYAFKRAGEQKPSKQESTIARDRAIVRNCKPSDFVVYAAFSGGRELVGIVRKENNMILYRRATNKGLGAWHVLQGYTKRMPAKEARRVFSIPQQINYYMVDVKQILKVTKREDTRETLQAGPHDRRPQEYILPGKYPKHK